MQQSWRRQQIWIAVTIYYLFLFYGSLVPFNFISLEGRLDEQVQKLLCSDWVIESRSDLAVNIILGIPAGFLVLGVFSSNRSFLCRLLCIAPTLLICFLGAIAVESFQIYLPGRNAAMTDVGAQLVGAIVGAGIWLFAGPGLSRGSYEAYQRATNGESLFYWIILYFFLLLVGALMPLDMVTSPQELYHKWKGGSFFLIPFSQFLGSSGTTESGIGVVSWNWLAIQQILETGFAFLPLGILTAWVAKIRKMKRLHAPEEPISAAGWFFSGWGVLLFWSIFMSVLTTFINIFVASREVYSSNIIIGVLFAFIGYLSFLWATSESRVRGLGLAGLAVWMFVLAIYYWYPFNFNFQKVDWSPLYSTENLIPLADYQLSNPLSALERLFSRCGNSLILSLLVCSMLKQTIIQKRIWVPILLCFICFSILETGQLFVPCRTFTLSDIIIQTIIAGIGCWIYHSILNIQR